MQQGIAQICNISQALVRVDKQLLMLLFCNLLFVQKIFIMFCTRLHREALGPPGDSRQEPRKCVGLCRPISDHLSTGFTVPSIEEAIQ